MAAEIKIAIGLLLLALFCGENYWVFSQGKEVQRAAALEQSGKGKDAVIGALVKNDADKAKKEAKQESISREVSHETQNELSAVRDFKPAVISLRFDVPAISGSDKSSTSEEGASTSGHDGTSTATVVLPEEITSELQADAKLADQVVAECRGLQKWVVKQGFYGPPEPTENEEKE